LLAEPSPPVQTVAEQVLGCTSLIKIAFRLRRLQDGEPAFRQGMTALARVGEPGTRDERYRRAKGGLLNMWGTCLAMTGREGDAEGPFRESLDLYLGLEREFPNVTQYRVEVAHGYLHRGNVLDGKGRLREAGHSYHEAVAQMRELVQKFPEAAGYRQQLAVFTNKHGEVLVREGRHQEAAVQFREAIRVCPDLAEPHFAPAWVLVNASDPKLHDGAEAVVRAEKAVALKDPRPHAWSVLGRAYYRADRWEDAIRALGKAQGVLPRGDLGDDFLYLALAHARLGRRSEALKSYETAQEIGQQRPLLEPLCAEAAALLGVAREPAVPHQEAAPRKD
jgi:tetratricopeptide (TPR) repeat protein